MSNTSEDSDSDGEQARSSQRRRSRRRRRNRNDAFNFRRMSESTLDEVDESTAESDNSNRQGNLSTDGRSNDNSDQAEDETAAEEAAEIGNPGAQDRMEVAETSSGEGRDKSASDEGDVDSISSSENSEGAGSDTDNMLSDESFETDDSDDVDNGPDVDSLFEGSRVSLREYMLAIQALSIRHKLTGQCLGDILDLIEMICPAENKCVKTLYRFKKYFAETGGATFSKQYYCSKCESALINEDQVCPHCEAGHQDVNYFLEVPIIPQLEKIFMRPGFYDSLEYRFQRNKKFAENIEDLWDGAIYREQMENGFLSNANNISFMWYTDGIAIYKSSHFSVWPKYLIINEMKYKERTKRENILLAGIWFGTSKPNPNVFSEPLHKECEQLEQEGHMFQRSDGEPVLVRAKILLGTGDLQVKCRFMYFKQWNGFHGSLKCLISGERFFINERCSIHVYPFSPNFLLRNNDDIPDFAAQAIRNRRFDPDADVYGVKGQSRLYFMFPNMIRCMAIDSMHGLSGVMKTVTNLWFDPAFVGLPFSLHYLSDVIDGRMKSLRPPDNCQKMPESISDFSQWKCLDYKLFLLHYSLPVLVGILPENYWQHHCKFVSAVSSLTKKSVSLDEINDARNLLESYVSNFQELYGLRYMSMNVHNLLHYADGVVELGPDWVYDCFFLEDLNGSIAALVHGSRHAGLQISSSVMAFLSLPARLQELDDYNAVRLFCQRMLVSGQRHVKKVFQITPSMYIASSFTSVDPVAPRIDVLLQRDLNIVNGRRRYFSRLLKKNVLYVATSHRYVQKLSCYALIRHNGVHLCKILHFVQWRPCDQECDLQCEICPARHFFIVETYQEVPWEVHDVPNVRMTCLKRIEPTGCVKVLPVESQITLCFYMSVGGHEYLSVPVNSLEIE